MTTHPACKLSPPQWLMTEEEFEPFRAPHFESIFTLANGYAGVRGSLEMSPHLGDPGMYVAGVFDETGGGQHEIVNLPCWLAMRANMDGFDFDLKKGKVLEYRRVLDMRQGILFTDIVWRDGAKRRTRWESARLVSMERKHTALLWGAITALDYSGRATLTSCTDAWAVRYLSASGLNHFADIEADGIENGGVTLSLKTAHTGIKVAMATALSVAAKGSRSFRACDDKVEETLSFRLERGKPVTFEKRAALYTSREADSPDKAARLDLAETQGVSVERLVREHVRAWKDIWDAADVRIEGDRRAQKAIRFNVFHLASLGNEADDRVSIGAKGLHGNGYRGMVFWDTETYLAPFFVFTRPQAARALLQYRCHHLPEARENARDVGAKGARFPWNSSITGRERAFSAFGWQEHLQADIAYAVDQYCTATGDEEFYLSCGARLIIETAIYWTCRLSFDEQKQQYVILNTCGTDETHTGINNNALTNHLARWHLLRAARAVADLKAAGQWEALRGEVDISDADVEKWTSIAGRMYMPFDERRGIHEQFDGYFALKEKKPDRRMTQMMHTGPVLHSQKPTKLLKQADTVLLYYMFPADFPEEVRANGFRYYEPRTTHASSLSRSIYAALAAQVGILGEAYRLFIDSAELDFGWRAENDSGIHAASLGGTWQAAVFGFGGFGIRDGLPSFGPRLPKRWRRMCYRVKWRGSVIEAVVGRRSFNLRASGGNVRALVNGTPCILSARGRTFPMPPSLRHRSAE